MLSVLLYFELKDVLTEDIPLKFKLYHSRSRRTSVNNKGLL